MSTPVNTSDPLARSLLYVRVHATSPSSAYLRRKPFGPCPRSVRITAPAITNSPSGPTLTPRGNADCCGSSSWIHASSSVPDSMQSTLQPSPSTLLPSSHASPSSSSPLPHDEGVPLSDPELSSIGAPLLLDDPSGSAVSSALDIDDDVEASVL